MSDHCEHCGAIRGKPRSLAHHRRYFSVIRSARAHWPESHPTQFDSDDECRYWLQMKCGHREIGARIELDGMSREQAMLVAEAAIRATAVYAVPVMHRNVLVIFRPKSIAWDKIDQREFAKLSDEVEALIEAETGLKVADLLKTEEAVA